MASSNALYQDFITYYNDYNKFIEEEKMQNTNKFCLTLFGVSGAGKSTFLARLKSDLATDEFYNTVINRQNDRMTLEDVTIGRGITSTTIVPKLHQVGKSGEISIYDVPGFKDTDDNKKIIINILHKCLLNHVKQNKFIAVLRLDVLEEEKMTQLVGDYYDSFAALFGKNFRRSIENVYFIITHFDKRNLSVKEIIAIIKDRMISAIDVDKDQLAFFLRRLSTKHIILDYREDSQEQLVYKLGELLVDKTDGIGRSEISIGGLDVYENELNKRLRKDLEDYIKSIMSSTERCMEDLTKQKESMQLSIKEKRAVKGKLEVVKKELDEVNGFLQNVDKVIEGISKKSETLEYEKDALVTETDAQHTILQVLDRTLAEEMLINVRVDIAQKAGVLGTGYYYDNIINIDPAQFKERVILITTVEDDDATLKKFLNTGSIIPNTIEDIKLFKSSITLYNNNTSLKGNIRVDSAYVEASKQLKISAKCDIPFKVYLYYTQEVNKNLIFNRTKNLFVSRITYNEAKCREIDEAVKENDKEIEMLKLKDTDKRARREHLMNLQTEHEIAIKEFEQKISQQNGSINEALTKHMNLLNGVKNAELYVIGNTILKIFNKNKLQSSINEQMVQINRYVEESASKLANFKEAVLKMQN